MRKLPELILKDKTLTMGQKKKEIRAGVFRSEVDKENILVPEYHQLHTRIDLDAALEPKKREPFSSGEEQEDWF